MSNKMMLRYWIDEDMLGLYDPHSDSVQELAKNPNAIEWMMSHPRFPEWEKYHSFWSNLCANPNPLAIELIEKRIEKYGLQKIEKEHSFCNEYKDICCEYLSENPNAIPLLEKYPELICWYSLYKNPNGQSLLEKNQDKIDWGRIVKSPYYIDLIKANVDKIYTKCDTDYAYLSEKYERTYFSAWHRLSKNPNPEVVDLFEANLDKLDWYNISEFCGSLEFLEKHIDKLKWGEYLSKNPVAIPLLEKNLDKIDWDELSGNPAAIPLLESNMDKVYWPNFLKNPNAVSIIEKHLENITSSDKIRILIENPNALYLFENLVNIRDFNTYSFVKNPDIFVPVKETWSYEI